MFHPSPESFVPESNRYGTIGRAMVALSNLEFAHDEFVVTVYERSPQFSARLSSTFPRQFKQKVDFAIHSIANSPKLKKQPIFGDGFLDLYWLQCQLDELYEIRSALAHGSVFLTETSKRGTVWSLDRFIKKRKNVWGKESRTIGDGFLADVAFTAEHLKRYFYSLVRALKEDADWHTYYKMQLQIDENNRHFRELEELGIITDGGFKALTKIPDTL